MASTNYVPSRRDSRPTSSTQMHSNNTHARTHEREDDEAEVTGFLPPIQHQREAFVVEEPPTEERPRRRVKKKKKKRREGESHYDVE